MISAIAGLVHFDGRGDAGTRLAQIANAMPSSPPAVAKIWDGATAALAHLQTIRTAQDRFETLPLEDSESGLVMTGAFRLDNREELFEALGIAHTDRANMPDGQLVMRAWKAWGADAMPRLLGDFSMAIWNPNDQSLTLTGDFAATQDVYYHHRDGQFAFASNPESLTALDDIDREIDEVMLVNGASGPLPLKPDIVKPKCMFKGIERLPGGFVYRFDRDGLTTSRYWNGETSRYAQNFTSDQDWYDHFDALFRDAVAVRMREERGVGVMLSGGLDSAAVAGVAAHVLAERGETLRTYTYRPGSDMDDQLEGWRISDEWASVEALAAMHSNMEPHWVRIGDLLPMDIDPRVDDFVFGPRSLNSSWASKIGALGEQHGVGAMLLGNAGNFSISWGGSIMHQGFEPISASVAAAKTLIMGSDKPNRSRWRRAARQLYDGIWPNNLVAMKAVLQNPLKGKFNTVLSDEALARYIDTDVASRIAKRKLRMPPSADMILPKRWENRVKNPVNSYDHMLTAYGITASDPTADRRVVEFCMTAPQRIFANDREDRLLVRKGLRRYLPPEVADRKLRGAQSCDGHYLARDHQPRMRQILADARENALCQRLYNFDQVEAELDFFADPDATFSYHRGLGVWKSISALDFVTREC